MDKGSTNRFINSTENLAKNGIVPGGSKKNLSYVSSKVDFSNDIKEHQQLMIADAQTSGGLLISINEKEAREFTNNFHGECQIIGYMEPKKKDFIRVI